MTFLRRMRQWDQQLQVFKTSRLIKYQEYGTYESHRGNISGRPCLSNSTPMTLHSLAKTSSSSISSCLFLMNIFFVIESASISSGDKQAAIPAPTKKH